MAHVCRKTAEASYLADAQNPRSRLPVVPQSNLRLGQRLSIGNRAACTLAQGGSSLTNSKIGLGATGDEVAVVEPAGVVDENGVVDDKCLWDEDLDYARLVLAGGDATVKGAVEGGQPDPTAGPLCANVG